MELLKFKRGMFNGGKFPNGWHLINDADAQQGEFTLCGIAYDGDGNQINADKKYTGKVTCENCKAIIRLCRQAKI